MILALMLAVQVGIFLATAFAVLAGRPRPDRPRPAWSSLALSLVVVAGTSWRIADSHAGEPGAELLEFGSALLLGMALMSILLLVRQRRGLDAPA
jgi:hypothetical protein